jgi:hypothetical protein
MDLLEHRLLRLVVFLIRCSDNGRPFTLEPTAARALHKLLLEAVAASASRVAVA